MARVSTNISLDSELKKEAQSLLDEFGLDLSTAVTLFLKQMIYENQIPFSIARAKPNQETLAAMEEVRQMKMKPELFKGYDNVDTMMEDLLS